MNMKPWLVLSLTLLLYPLPAGAQGGDTAGTAGQLTDSIVTAVDTAAPSAATAADSGQPGSSEAPPRPGITTKDIVVVKENLDTVFIFDKSVFRHVARDWRNNIDIFRQRGYGIAGSTTHGANAIFMRPVEELTDNDPYLSNKKFNFSKFGFEPFLMSGGSGVVGLGEGFRLGGGGVSGERKFSSNRFNGDSILILNTKVSYGGFLVEKCFINGRWNFSAGGMIGAGSLKVAISEQTNTWFDVDEVDDIDEDWNSEKAAFLLLEPHFSFSYTFLYFFHVGASLTVPAFMSLEKFNAYTDDFLTVNPGLHVKLIFGNLG